MYNVEYLLSAVQDMVEIVTYIARELNNPSAAERIAERLVEAGESLRDFPYALYWVTETEKRVTIARVVYARRNYAKLLE